MFKVPNAGAFLFIFNIIFCKHVLYAETIFVTAVQLPQELPVGSHSEVIEEDEIQSTRYRDVLDVLESAMGIYIQKSNSLQQDKINIRGFSGQQLKILVNGLPFDSAGSSLQDLSLIPKESVKRIYLSRGAMSSVYGNSAMGGVINIITNPLLDGGVGLPLNNLKLSTGSFGQKTISGRYSRKASAYNLSLGGQYESEAGNYLVRNRAAKELFDPEQYESEFSLQNNNSKNFAMNAAASHQFGVANLSYSQLDRGIPGRVGHRLYAVRQQNSSSRVDLVTESMSIINNELKIGIYVSDSMQLLDDPQGEINGFSLRQEQESKSGGLEINSQLFLNILERNKILPHWRILFAQEVFSFADERHSRDTATFGVGFNWNVFEDFTVTANLSLVTASHEMDQSSQGLSMNYELFSSLTFKANFVEGFRYPSFIELYTQQGAVVGNPSLKAEKNRGYDFGLELKDRRLKLAVNYFRYDSKDLIEYVSVSGFQFKPFNFSKARAEGVESSLHAKWTEKFSQTLNVTLQETKDSDPNSEYFGKRIPGQAQYFGSLSIQFQPSHRNTFYVSQMIARDRYVNRSNTQMLLDNKQLNAGWGFQIRDDWRFNFDAKNLLDEQNEDLRGYALPSRSYYLGLEKIFI